MDFTKLTAVIFGVIFIIILYVIIYYALKIMYKDVKGGGKRRPPERKRNHGVEILEIAPNSGVQKGTVLPIRTDITIGRNEDNTVVLQDKHVSLNHARFEIRNNLLFVEDLNSTNGVYVNGKRIKGKAKLYGQDKIKIGTTIFKVLG